MNRKGSTGFHCREVTGSVGWDDKLHSYAQMRKQRHYLRVKTVEGNRKMGDRWRYSVTPEHPQGKKNRLSRQYEMQTGRESNPPHAEIPQHHEVILKDTATTGHTASIQC